MYFESRNKKHLAKLHRELDWINSKIEAIAQSSPNNLQEQ